MSHLVGDTLQETRHFPGACHVWQTSNHRQPWRSGRKIFRFPRSDVIPSAEGNDKANEDDNDERHVQSNWNVKLFRTRNLFENDRRPQITTHTHSASEWEWVCVLELTIICSTQCDVTSGAKKRTRFVWLVRWTSNFKLLRHFILLKWYIANVPLEL